MLLKIGPPNVDVPAEACFFLLFFYRIECSKVYLIVLKNNVEYNFKHDCFRNDKTYFHTIIFL